MEKFEQLKAVLESVSFDVEKTANGNKAAGVRVRKALQEVRTLAYDLRKEISALSKGE
jgi:energy-coupling factor transporter ATP-binding protein EcfA2